MDALYIHKFAGVTIMAKTKTKIAETAAFVEKYKGNKTFGIWNVDEDGDKTGDYPLIAFGIKKAEAILEHIDELEEYVEQERARLSAESEEDEPKSKAKKGKSKSKPRRSSDSDDD